MNFKEIEILLEKYNWILESKSPLNIRSKDGEHFATNFAAELTIEWFAVLDSTNDQDEIEATIDRFKFESDEK